MIRILISQVKLEKSEFYYLKSMLLGFLYLNKYSDCGSNVFQIGRTNNFNQRIVKCPAYLKKYADNLVCDICSNIIWLWFSIVIFNYNLFFYINLFEMFHTFWMLVNGYLSREMMIYKTFLITIINFYLNIPLSNSVVLTIWNIFA